MSHPENFVSHLRHLAATRPHDTALVVVREQQGQPDELAIDYAGMDARVRALAARLQAFPRGERVLLAMDNDEHYVISFFACLYAGLIAVPVCPPESTRQQHLARLVGIADDADARCVLTTRQILPLIEAVASRSSRLSVWLADEEQAAGEWAELTPDPQDIAFLQYTSGSTSAPKGVMVSHASLMANERAIEEGMMVTDNDVTVSWLPLFHDMGLIGGMLQPFHRGIKCVLMSPRFFLEKPARWLQAISRHRGSISGGPDFAYRLCLERIGDDKLATLDLSSWRVAFSGAEPVRQDTLSSFIARFADAAFNANAVYPCYGLAEATLFVSGGIRGGGLLAPALSRAGLAQGEARPAEAGEDSIALVSCGRVPGGHQVAIVDAANLSWLPDGRSGEIWFNGPSVASGYWGNPDATAAAFVEKAGQRWLRTGDLGFWRDGQLYINGRVKDLIIIRGHNLYPQDIERQIESQVEAVRAGRVAAFAVHGPNGEGIGIAAEVSRGMQKLIPTASLIEALSNSVSELCGEPLSVVVLLNPGTLPKTSSGKLQRNACAKGWENASLDSYATYAFGQLQDSTPDEQRIAPAVALQGMAAELATLWRATLRLPEQHALHADSHFFACGGNSLAMVQLAARLRAQWQIAPELPQLFLLPRLGEMASWLEQYRQNTAPCAIENIPLRAANLGEPCPASSAQQRQYFLWQYQPTGSAYHIAAARRLHGQVNLVALQQVFNQLVSRHEALRTVFVSGEDGAILQRVLPSSDFAVAVHDVRALDETARTAAAQDVADALQHTPFDLASGPLLRVGLIQESADRAALVVVMHHIISDGWSMDVIVKEFVALYQAAVTGVAANLLPLPIQYADYAQWQRHWLEAGERERQLAYWRAQLGHDHPVLQLPADHPRRADGQYRSASFQAEVSSALTQALQQLARDSGSTLFMLLLTAFQAMLHRHSGLADIRVGVPIANRHRVETENVVGFFVNTQVLRAEIAGRMTLSSLLAQVRERALGAQAHQDLPFEQLVEALQPERTLGVSPLFQLMFNHLREAGGQLQNLPDLTISDYALGEQAAQFELTLNSVERDNGGLALSFDYARELFDADTVARWAGHYLAMLDALANAPETAIADVALLSASEQSLLQSWGVNKTRYPDVKPVHELFEAQVAANPQAIALIFGETELTYRELDRRANRLAHQLLAQGIKREARIGIALERSIEMVVGLLAILKAGAAYVPLDPDYPADRLAHMVDDAGLSLLLTHSALVDQLPAANVPVVLVDVVPTTDYPASKPSVMVHPEQLAYVIYTSGSTGRPKGAANRHVSVASCMLWMQQHYVLSGADTVLHKAPFCFDVSVWEIFWPLTSGARLVVSQPGDHRDPERITRLIEQHQITTLNFVPAMLQAFLAHEGIEARTRLRYVICGGEAMPAATQHEALQRLQGASLQNLYGPTEAAIHVTHWTCRDDGNSNVPIGRPVSNTLTRVLDSDLNLVPPGVAGELYLGGIQLGRGYWDRPDLSAQIFIADPFDANGGRLYRTGDLVRWNSEGQLEYLGRIDHQVKIRGFRIELGEIEAQLLAQDAVREAVVVARHDDGNARLVAYVSLKAGETTDAANLKAAIATALPDYMLPSAIVLLDALPLNPNGKVDRKALPAPEFTAAGEYVAPEGEVEEKLAAIWAEVLGVAQVGRHDSFFELGGHSLLLLKLHSLMNAQGIGPMTIVDLFRYPSIAAQARRLQQGEDHGQLEQAAERARQQRAAMLKRRQPHARQE